MDKRHLVLSSPDASPSTPHPRTRSLVTYLASSNSAGCSVSPFLILATSSSPSNSASFTSSALARGPGGRWKGSGAAAPSRGRWPALAALLGPSPAAIDHLVLLSDCSDCPREQRDRRQRGTKPDRTAPRILKAGLMGIKGLGAVYATQGGERLLGRIGKQISNTSKYRFLATRGKWKTVLRLDIDVHCASLFVRAGGCSSATSPSKQSFAHKYKFLWPHPRDLHRYSSARRLACFLLRERARASGEGSLCRPRPRV